ncbi:hypothetical protein [Paenibacillus ehimensis]|uniref:hypothetical protein n=1 Tax=Paenibacillus ehimensis TaxID=79264 RepID=UPI000471D19B|nr:hypothetical protein [Paenibacillus ehimensis]
MSQLKQFWSDIKNVENATPENIQSDILAYLDEIERLTKERDDLQKILNDVKTELSLWNHGDYAIACIQAIVGEGGGNV